MNEHLLPLAGAGVDGLFHSWVSSDSGRGYFFLVLGILLLVSLFVFIWAAFFRKQPRRRHSHHWKFPKPAANGAAEAPTQHRPRFRFWRRHRPIHKKRLPNPTLAETGGLPPARANDAEPPPTI